MRPRAVIDDQGVKFSPPAYLQRYGDVCDILKDDERWAGELRKVVDFGCAELSFFTFLKSIPNIRSVLEVDFDGELLERFCDKAEPLFYDHLIRRPTPLHVQVLQGSVCDPDDRLVGCDALVAIELIEHLEPASLERLPHNIFGFIRPRVAIITTPNVEFNVLFPQLKDGGFRHYDHRFEWTRDEFHDWALNVVSRYPDYSVEMRGIAPGPDGTEHLGCCSQMALFVNTNWPQATTDGSTDTTAVYEGVNIKQNGDISRTLNCECNLTTSLEPVNKRPSENDLDHNNKHSENGIEISKNDSENSSYYSIENNVAGCSSKISTIEETEPKPTWDCRVWEKNERNSHSYKLIKEFEYPFLIDNRTKDEKILANAMNKILTFINYNDECYQEDEDRWKISLHHLVTVFGDNKTTVDDLRRVLTNDGHEVKDSYLYYKHITDDSESEDLNISYESMDVTTNDTQNTYVEESWDVDEIVGQSMKSTVENNTNWGEASCPNKETNSETNGVIESQPKLSLYKNDRLSDSEADRLNEEIAAISLPDCDVVAPEMVDSGASGLCEQEALMVDSTNSATDDHSHSGSPLAQFYGPNRDSTDEQKLSDSGYIKSQDSPQSPVCSDTFSNDLITPDKDLPDLQSTILECIPENLNCLTSQTTIKDAKHLESRRKSIGPGIGSEETKSEEFQTDPCMTRPKSLHTCSTSSQIDGECFKSNEFPGMSFGRDSPEKKLIDGIESPCDMKDSPSSNLPSNLSPSLLLPSPKDDLRGENVPRLPIFVMGQRHQQERQNLQQLERLPRPDFLDVRNLDVAVVENGDRLNNNLDFEGNHFEGNDDEDGENFEGGENFGDLGELLRQHWDRHNENHLVVNEEDNQELLPGPGRDQEPGEIEEEMLEYQENFEENENDGSFELFMDRFIYAIISNEQPDINVLSPTTSSNLLEDASDAGAASVTSPTTCEADDAEHADTNILLDSIAKSLKMNSEDEFCKTVFPCCSKRQACLTDGAIKHTLNLESEKHIKIKDEEFVNTGQRQNDPEMALFSEHLCDLSKRFFPGPNNSDSKKETISALEINDTLLSHEDEKYLTDKCLDSKFNLNSDSNNPFSEKLYCIKDGQSILLPGESLNTLGCHENHSLDIDKQDYYHVPRYSRVESYSTASDGSKCSLTDNLNKLNDIRKHEYKISDDDIHGGCSKHLNGKTDSKAFSESNEIDNTECNRKCNEFGVFSSDSDGTNNALSCHTSDSSFKKDEESITIEGPLNPISEASISSRESTSSDFAIPDVSVISEWLMRLMDYPHNLAALPDVGGTRQARLPNRDPAAGLGDGRGIHSQSSDVSSGHFSITSNSSNVAQVNSLEQWSVSTLSNIDTPPSFSWSVSSIPSVASDSVVIPMPDITPQVSSDECLIPNNNLSDADVSNTFRNSSNTSANDADVENESE